MNLLQETLEFLSDNSRKPEDVEWVGGDTFWFTWDEFAALADVEYDKGYGSQEVASDLIIWGDDFRLVRAEYEGSEWWEFQHHIWPRPHEHRVPKRLTGGNWATLEQTENIT